jgi:hypothetical protein
MALRRVAKFFFLAAVAWRVCSFCVSILPTRNMSELKPVTQRNVVLVIGSGSKFEVAQSSFSFSFFCFLPTTVMQLLLSYRVRPLKPLTK